MTPNSQKIRFYRSQIPTFECTSGCHDCCGPVTASSEEVALLPIKTDAEHDAALEELNCVYLGPNGCTVYNDRPLICRLFGTTRSMPCPNEKGPEEMIDKRIEDKVHGLLKSTRQVLL